MARGQNHDPQIGLIIGYEATLDSAPTERQPGEHGRLTLDEIDVLTHPPDPPPVSSGE